MLGDLTEAALAGYRSEQVDPPDFDAFWEETLTAARSFPLALTRHPVDAGLSTIEVFDLVFAGYGGHPIHAWLRLPRERSGPLPAVVQFLGYGAGRGFPTDDLVWSAAGYAHLVVDARGQGTGETADPVGAGPGALGFLTRGIESRETYYYRRVYTDAVRAIEAVRTLPEVDPARVAMVGASQGGGIALAVAGLVPDLAAVLLQSPFLCDFPHAITRTDELPFAEIAAFLKARREDVAAVYRTLSFFDGVNFARRARAPAWFSAGLMDSICPPSTAFAARNVYGGASQIVVWPFNGHDAGGAQDVAGGIRVLRDVFA
jgi:cephalosporin-C deacetylase